jgi:hypothetical protein
MSSKQALNDKFDSLIESYKTLFQQCADALAPDASQETRDALRRAIEEFLNKS